MELSEMIHFAHPSTLFREFESALNDLGPKKLMDGSGERAKSAREALFEWFFISALRKHTGRDWWLRQATAHSRFPDFSIMSFGETILDVRVFEFELVTIPARCKNFDEMFDIVTKKFNKGYPPKCNLLIFINHQNSEPWVQELNRRLEKYYPFTEVWTSHLLFQGQDNPYSSVAHRLRPEYLRIVANFSDPETSRPQQLPSFLEEISSSEGKTYMQVNTTARKNLRSHVKRYRRPLQ